MPRAPPRAPTQEPCPPRAEERGDGDHHGAGSDHDRKDRPGPNRKTAAASATRRRSRRLSTRATATAGTPCWHNEAAATTASHRRDPGSRVQKPSAAVDGRAGGLPRNEEQDGLRRRECDGAGQEVTRKRCLVTKSPFRRDYGYDGENGGYREQMQIVTPMLHPTHFHALHNSHQDLHVQPYFS